MTTVFGGWKEGYGPVLKIMQNDTDDPLTTPNDHYNKFRFNSETTELGYLYDIFTVVWDNTLGNGSTGLDFPKMYPTGSNYTNFLFGVQARGLNNSSAENFQQWYFTPAYFGVSYIPLVEFRTAFGENIDTFNGPGAFKGSTGDTWGGWHNSYQYSSTNSSGDCMLLTNGQYDYNYSVYHVAVKRDYTTKLVVSVFDLPADDTPLPVDVSVPASGDEFFYFSPSMLRIAKPGYQYTETDPKKFILHEDRIPAKIMAAGEISVAAGDGSTAEILIPTGMTLTPTTYMDYLVRKDTTNSYDLTFFNPPFCLPGDNNPIGFNYQVLSDRVIITNKCIHQLVIRYMILADSDADYTTGGEKSVFVSDDGSFWQVKRPGSSDTAPSLNDIMLDTRLAYLPLIAEGFLNWPDDFPTEYTGNNKRFGERYVDIPISNPSGVKLFPKHTIMLPAYRERDLDLDLSAEVFGPSLVMLLGTSYNNRLNQTSGYAQIAADEQSIRFSMAGDNPYFWNTLDRRGTGHAKGMRYYVFGLPSL